MPISVFSVPLKKHFVTHSRCSHAYCFFLAYWISLVAVPVIVLSSTPTRFIPKLQQPNLTYTGNYFISADGNESSVVDLSPGVTVTVEQRDEDSDGVVDTFVASANSFAFQTVKSLFLALEVSDPSGDLSIVHFKIDDIDGGNRMTGWYQLQVDSWRTLSRGSSGLLQALAKPGNKGLTKVGSVDTLYTARLIKFGSIVETAPNSNTFSGVLWVDVPIQMAISTPSRNDTFFSSLVLFVSVSIVNYVILERIAKLVLKLGLVRLKVINSHEAYGKEY